MRIPVTRNFDNLDPIGYLTLQDGVEIPPNSVFSLAYTVLKGTARNPTKIQVQSVSLIAESAQKEDPTGEKSMRRDTREDWTRLYNILTEPEPLPIKRWLTTRCIGYQLDDERQRYHSVYEGSVEMEDGREATAWQIVAPDDLPDMIPNTFLSCPHIDIPQVGL